MGIGRIMHVHEQPDEEARHRQHQRRRADHEHHRHPECGPACARDADRILPAIGDADAHRRRLPDAERHHEAERGDLDRDGMGGELRLADQPHQEDRGVEDRHLHAQRHRDRQAKPPHLAEARPVGSPEMAEQVIAAELALARDDDRQHHEHHQVGDAATEPGAEQPECRQPEAPEDQAIVDDCVGDDRDTARRKRPARPLQRRDEGFEHLIAEQRQHSEHHRPDQPRRLMRECRILPEQQQDGFRMPEQQPDRDHHRHRRPQRLPHRAAHVADVVRALP